MKKLYIYLKYFFYNIFKKILNKDYVYKNEIKLNLGCGFDYKVGWVNIDTNASCVVDLNCDFFNLDKYFKKKSVSHIVLNHSISYLNLWQARDFFLKTFQLLKDGGVLEMEFPDVFKCANIISKTTSNEEYLEAIRGFYAFDLEQLANKEMYTPYSFGWSSKHISFELKEVGFSKVQILNPLTHGPREWRDSRVLAYKNI